MRCIITITWPSKPRLWRIYRCFFFLEFCLGSKMLMPNQKVQKMGTKLPPIKLGQAQQQLITHQFVEQKLGVQWLLLHLLPLPSNLSRSSQFLLFSQSILPQPWHNLNYKLGLNKKWSSLYISSKIFPRKWKKVLFLWLKLFTLWNK